MRKKKKYIIILAVAFLLIGWGSVRMMIPEKFWSFEADELEVSGERIWFEKGVVNENKPGWYVDNSMEYGEDFARTPKVNLPMGSYDVTIMYQTRGNSSRYSFESEQQDYRVMLGRTDEILEEEKESKTLEVNYWKKMPGFSVKTSYGGEGYLIINEIKIQQTRRMERMVIIGTLLIGACFAVFSRIKNNRILKIVVISGIFTTVFSMLPMLSPYLVKAVDLPFHFMRIEGIAEGLKAGYFPVKMQSVWMNDYGYPVSIFYGDMLLGSAGIFRLIGFPLQSAYKIYVFIIGFLTFMISWYSFKRIAQDWKVAMIVAVMYTISPYRLMRVYVAAVGSYSGFVFFPLIFVGAYEILMNDSEKRKNSWILLMAGMTGVIQNHILSTEIAVLILGITCLVCWRRFFEKTRLVDFIKAGLGTAILSCYFLIPFLDYMREDLKITGEYGGHIQSSGTFIGQILGIYPERGANLSVFEGLQQPEATYAIGVAFIIALIMYFVVRGNGTADEKKYIKLGNYCSAAGIILLFMTTVWFPWDMLYDLNTILAMLISKIQFPWRLVGAATLMLSVVTCIVLKLWKEKKTNLEWYGLVSIFLGCSIFTAGYFLENVYREQLVYVPDSEAISSFEIGWGEYVPQGTDPSEALMPKGKIWHNELVKIHDTKKEGTTYTLSVSNTSPEVQTVELPMTYYKYYQAEDIHTGGEVLVGAGENGRIRVSLAGNYEGIVQVSFKEPMLWRISECISLIGAIGIVCYILKQKKGTVLMALAKENKKNG